MPPGTHRDRGCGQPLGSENGSMKKGIKRQENLLIIPWPYCRMKNNSYSFVYNLFYSSDKYLTVGFFKVFSVKISDTSIVSTF